MSGPHGLQHAATDFIATHGLLCRFEQRDIGYIGPPKRDRIVFPASHRYCFPHIFQVSNFSVAVLIPSTIGYFMLFQWGKVNDSLLDLKVLMDTPFSDKPLWLQIRYPPKNWWLLHSEIAVLLYALIISPYFAGYTSQSNHPNMYTYVLHVYICRIHSNVKIP